MGTPHTTTITASTPFSLKATVLSHGWHECSPMSWTEGGRCFQVIERAGNAAVRVSVTEKRRSSKSVTLNIAIDGSDTDKALVDRIVERVRFVLGLDQDLDEFYDLCRDHPVLHVIPRIGAGRMLRSASMAENIVKAICATNVNWTQAVKMINRIGQLGPCVPHFRNLNAWPTPGEITRAGEGYLRNVARLGYRVETILAFCDDVARKRTNPEDLLDLSSRDGTASDELLALLKRIRGIGPSSAHFLLSALDRHDRLSIDSATLAFVSQAHLNGKKATPKHVEKLYAPYGRWKNKVWWYEHWLTWGTARGILREEGVEMPKAARTGSP